MHHFIAVLWVTIDWKPIKTMIPLALFSAN